MIYSLRWRTQPNSKEAPLAGVIGISPFSSVEGASQIGTEQGLTVQDLLNFSSEGDPRVFGYIGDGASHPLSSVAPGRTLNQWKVIYPGATSLSNEIDGLAIQKLIDSQSGRALVLIPEGNGRSTNPIVASNKMLIIKGAGKYSTIIDFYNCDGFKSLHPDGAGVARTMHFDGVTSRRGQAAPGSEVGLETECPIYADDSQVMGFGLNEWVGRNATASRIRNCSFDARARYGNPGDAPDNGTYPRDIDTVFITSENGNAIYQMMFDNVIFANGSWGFTANMISYFEGIFFDRCHWLASKHAARTIQSTPSIRGLNWRFTNCEWECTEQWFDLVGLIDVQITGAFNLTLGGETVENAIRVDNCKGVKIVNNYLTSNNFMQRYVRLTNCEGWSVDENSVEYNNADSSGLYGFCQIDTGNSLPGSVSNNKPVNWPFDKPVNGFEPYTFGDNFPSYPALFTNRSAYKTDAYGSGFGTGYAVNNIVSGDSSDSDGTERYAFFVSSVGSGTGDYSVIGTTFGLGSSAIKENWTNTTRAGQFVGHNVVVRGGYHGTDANVAPPGYGYNPAGDITGGLGNVVGSSEYSQIALYEGRSIYAKNGAFDDPDFREMNVQFGAMRMKNPDGSPANLGTGVALNAAAGNLGTAFSAGSSPGASWGKFLQFYTPGAPAITFEVDGQGNLFTGSVIQMRSSTGGVSFDYRAADGFGSQAVYYKGGQARYVMGNAANDVFFFSTYVNGGVGQAIYQIDPVGPEGAGTPEIQLKRGSFAEVTSAGHNVAGSQRIIGFSGIVFNENASFKQTVYGIYGEAVRYAGTGASQASEFNAANGGNTVDIDPFNAVGDITASTWLSAGLTTRPGFNNPISASGVMINNGAYARRGFVFRSGLLDPAGPLEFIAAPTGTRLAWYSGSGAIAARLSDTDFIIKEMAAASAPTPPSGSQTVFIDTADNKLKRKNSSGSVVIIN